MSKSTRHAIHRDDIRHGWNNAFPPARKIAPGESFNFETLDASSRQLTRTPRWPAWKSAISPGSTR